MNKFHRLCLVTGIAASFIAACGGGGDAASAPPPPKLAAANPDQACQQLATAFQLEGTSVDAATYVAAGFVPPGSATPVAQPFCRVQLTSRPSIDSDIKSELWMPALSSWNDDSWLSAAVATRDPSSTRP
jgi:hypothetical protein